MTELICLLPVFFAAVCFLAGLWLRRTKRGGIRHPVYVQAAVVSRVTQMGTRHNAAVELSAPVVRYMTERGEITAAYRRYLPEWQYTYRMGEQITICYEKDNPTVFRICRDRRDLWGSDLLFVTGAGTLLAYAVLWLQYY